MPLQAVSLGNSYLGCGAQESLEWRPYVIKSNMVDPLRAKVIVLLERHTHEENKHFNGQLIDLWCQEKDLILIEAFSDAKKEDLINKISGYIKKSPLCIAGWKSPEIKEKEIVIEDQPPQKVKDLMKKIMPLIAYINPYVEIHDHLDEKGKEILSLINRAVFEDNQNSLIGIIDRWVEDNKDTPSKLIVLMGRRHGNPELDPSRKSSIENLWVSLGRTSFIIIDYLSAKT